MLFFSLERSNGLQRLKAKGNHHMFRIVRKLKKNVWDILVIRLLNWIGGSSQKTILPVFRPM